MGRPPDVVHLPPRKEAMHVEAAHDDISVVFGARRQTRLEDGLLRMAGWVREHGARRSEPFRSLEITRDLPESWVS